MSQPDAIVDAAGMPATVRVGIVVSTSPLLVSVQGTVFRDLGRIGSLPAVDDVVLLLGIAVKGSASSGSSWVVLGEIIPS